MMQGSDRIIGARPLPVPPVTFEEFPNGPFRLPHSTILGFRRYARPIAHRSVMGW